MSAYFNTGIFFLFGWGIVNINSGDFDMPCQNHAASIKSKLCLSFNECQDFHTFGQFHCFLMIHTSIFYFSSPQTLIKDHAMVLMH